MVHLNAGDRTEQPDQQIKEMDANVRRHTTRFILMPLPGDLIPRAAARNISQVYIMNGLFFLKRFAKLDQRGVYAQLQNRVDAVFCFHLDLFEGIQIPGVDHKRLFADRVCSRTQGKATV